MPGNLNSGTSDRLQSSGFVLSIPTGPGWHGPSRTRSLQDRAPQSCLRGFRRTGWPGGIPLGLADSSRGRTLLRRGKMNLAEQVHRAGVVGAGGAGFPTHVKLSGRAEIVIAN